MEPPPPLCLFLFLLLHLLLLCTAAASSSSSSFSSIPNNPDLPPLLAFKDSADPTGKVLPSWAPASDPCNGQWLGVACRDSRVTRLLLPNLTLAGPIQALTLLPHLRLLNLSHNRLSGPVPAGFLLLTRLRRLDISGNLFSGPIPPELGLLLPRLVTLRLEDNLLSGEIPRSLESVHGLSEFNVSGNDLAGEIPLSLSSFPASSFSGNPGLCGKPLLSFPCGTVQSEKANSTPLRRRRSQRFKLVLAIVTGTVVAVALIVVAAVLCFFIKHRRKMRSTGIRKRSTTTTTTNAAERVPNANRRGRTEDKSVVFFQGCRRFKVDELMRGSAEMLGRGAAGTTYRVVAEGEVGGRGVVAKRVRRAEGSAAAGGGWAAMVEGLLKEIGELRHPNVVGLRAYYFSGGELLLVYDFLPNGSLHSLLHGTRGPGRTPVDWATRLKLASDAAKGLAYLHTTCKKSKLCHQHLTSSNILVDDAGNACISDFGLHHLLSPPSSRRGTGSTSSSSSSNATQKSDVYAFGVVLLEVLTGRTDGEGGMELKKWVERVVSEEWTSEVFDLEMLGERESEDEMVALLQVALLCTSPAAGDRPKMRVVARMIEDIRERGSRGGEGGRRGLLSPSSSANDLSGGNSSTGATTPSVSEETPTVTSS